MKESFVIYPWCTKVLCFCFIIQFVHFIGTDICLVPRLHMSWLSLVIPYFSLLTPLALLLLLFDFNFVFFSSLEFVFWDFLIHYLWEKMNFLILPNAYYTSNIFCGSILPLVKFGISVVSYSILLQNNVCNTPEQKEIQKCTLDWN